MGVNVKPWWYFLIVFIFFVVVLIGGVAGASSSNIGVLAQDSGEYRDMNPFPSQVVSARIDVFDVGRDNDGGVLVVYLEEVVGAESRTYLSMARMLTGTGNWSHSRICELSLPPAIPVTVPSVTSLAFFEDSQGICWIVLATREDATWIPGDNPANMSLWLLESDDGGESWSEPWRIPFQYVKGGDSWGFFDISFCEDSCGVFWIVFKYRFYYRGNRLTLYIQSDDRGLTWSSPERFSIDGLWASYGSSGNPIDVNGFYESFLTSIDDRIYLVYLQNLYLGRGQVWIVNSTDCGETWQQPERLLPSYGSVPHCRLYEEPIRDRAGNNGIISSRLWLFWVSPGEDHCYLKYLEDNGGGSGSGGSGVWEPFGFFEYPSGNKYEIVYSGNMFSENPGDNLFLFWTKNNGGLYYAPVSEDLTITFFILIILGLILANRFLNARMLVDDSYSHFWEDKRSDNGKGFLGTV